MPKTTVEIIESERGWGSKVDETKEFDSYDEAYDYCVEYNNKHNPPMDETPDWYMYARIQGDTRFGMLR